MVSMSIADSVLVLYGHHSALKRLLCQTALVCPCTVKMTHPYVSNAYRQISRIEACQCNRLLLEILDLCPCLDHVHVLICTVAYGHIKWIYCILQADARHLCRRFISLRNAFHLEDCRHVSVHMGHGKRRLRRAVESVWRISVMVRSSRRLEICKVSVSKPASEICDLQFLSRLRIQYQLDIRRSDTHLSHSRQSSANQNNS